jgi:hypothetical protein
MFALDPTSWLHLDGFVPIEEVTVAPDATGALTIEIADKVETVKTKVKTWLSNLRTLILKVALLKANLIYLLLSPNAQSQKTTFQRKYAVTIETEYVRLINSRVFPQ